MNQSVEFDEEHGTGVDVKDVTSLQQNKGIRLTEAESASLFDTIITHQKWILSSLKILFN